MKISLSLKMLRSLTCVLFFISVSNAGFSFQNEIHGIINKYGRITEMGTDYVIVNDPVQFAQFATGDTVLLIQLKGVASVVEEGPFFGIPQDTVGAPGKYEFIIIQSINAGLKKIVFRNNVINSFDVSGNIQIIKAPYYNSVIVDDDLTCAAWDSVSKTGGVLSMIVGHTIRLNSNIDVTGKGFLGGGTVIGSGICVISDPTFYDKFSYSQSSTNSGLKGESPVTKGWVDYSTQYPIFPNYSKGKGPNFSGGGGGNGNFSGGGGGANYGSGGRGGRETIACLLTFNGGIGGKQIGSTPLDGGIFPGSGGGSSTYYSGSTPSPGGNGGGIIIILCDTLIGNGKIIMADGAGASSVSGNAGAGGGGGGGSIALHIAGFSTSNLTISAKGGKGGDNPAQTFGEGGGGGGGLIWINNTTISGNVARTNPGGSVGLRMGGSTGSNGTPGESLSNFLAILNGFLFNSIRSSVTGDQVDSIYSNVLPPKITGTKPVGGTLSYTYLWEKSYDKITWTPLINDTDPTNYTPSVIETRTVYFRRTITDSSIPAWIDVSIPVKIGIKLITDIHSEISNKSFKIYPNPGHSSVELSLNDNACGRIEIVLYNIAGQPVASYLTDKNDINFRYTIPVSHLPRGIYSLRLCIDHKFYSTGKMILAN